MVRAFGRALTKDHEEGKINGITVIENIPNITHQQYADNTILPCDSSMSEALNIKSIIQLYMEASGQKVNASKLDLFFINTLPEKET